MGATHYIHPSSLYKPGSSLVFFKTSMPPPHSSPPAYSLLQDVHRAMVRKLFTGGASTNGNGRRLERERRLRREREVIDLTRDDDIASTTRLRPADVA